jgi:hypothetical protein
LSPDPGILSVLMAIVTAAIVLCIERPESRRAAQLALME